MGKDEGRVVGAGDEVGADDVETVGVGAASASCVDMWMMGKRSATQQYGPRVPMRLM